MIDNTLLLDEIKKINMEKVKIIFPYGEDQMLNVGKEILYYLNNKIEIDKLYSLYIRDYFFTLIDSDIYSIYKHMLMRYNNVLNADEIYKYISILMLNKTTPDYQFNEKNKVLPFYEYIKDAIKLINENDLKNEMKGSFGNFGYEKTNPIPVSGHNGLNDYLSKLSLNNGHDIKYMRQGSTFADNINGIIDIYLILDAKTNEEITNLYICIYNKTTSDNIPNGFCFKDKSNR